MTDPGPRSVADTIKAIREGDRQAASELVRVVYADLRNLARSMLAKLPPGQTLQATALVHEAYVRLLGPDQEDLAWNSRGHFFGAAAQAMRRILVEKARRRGRYRHGGDRKRVDLEELDLIADVPSEDILAVEEIVSKLEQRDPRKASIINLRYFAGLTMQETADALDVSLGTVEREWRFIKALILAELQDPPTSE